jgi:hypothetical protein
MVFRRGIARKKLSLVCEIRRKPDTDSEMKPDGLPI